MFYSYLKSAFLCLTAPLIFSCGEHRKPSENVAQPGRSPAESVVAPVQVRIYQVSQASFPEGYYQVFGLYIDNHTPDSLCTIHGRLVYCGEKGDTLAFIDFKPEGTCNTNVTLIAGKDTAYSQENFNIRPDEETLESVSFSLKDGMQLHDELNSMPDRFSCLWFPEKP